MGETKALFFITKFRKPYGIASFFREKKKMRKIYCDKIITVIQFAYNIEALVPESVNITY